MRIRMLAEVYTVGQLLERGNVYDVQDALAKSLIRRKQAVDTEAPPTPKVTRPGPKPIPVPEAVVETAPVAEAAPAEKVEEKPEKEAEEKPEKKAVKKPSSKKPK